MELLLNKLSNLSYEILGIILPGFITLILFILLIVGTGDLLPAFSNDFFPRLTLRSTSNTLESIGVRTGVGIAGPAILIAYFIGHLLHWISRSGKGDDELVKNNFKRTWLSITFRVPKHSTSYDKNLQPLLDALKPKFHLSPEAEWRQFFSPAKHYLIRTSNTSLVSVYQNKYTLHRSITTGAALIFWLSIISMAIGIISAHFLCVEPRWIPLCFLAVGCLVVTWGFSDSYAYNWKMFGNTIITETYSLLFGPSTK